MHTTLVTLTPTLNGQSHESWHVTESILSALQDAWDLFSDHPRIDRIWKKSTKMLIASHSQLAELARPIFISHFSFYHRIQICRGCIFAQQWPNDDCWHLRDHRWPWWCWRWHRWYCSCCSDRHRWQMTYLDSRCRHTSGVACHLRNIFIAPAWKNIYSSII